MRRIIILMVAVLTLAGCVATGGQSVMLAMAPAETKQAFDVLGQRTDAEVRESERVIGTLSPGQAGYFLLANGKPVIIVRSKSRPNWISVWMDDRAGRLVNIEGRVESRSGRTVYVNPAVTPWRGGEEAKARELYGQVLAKLTAPAGTAVATVSGWSFRATAEGEQARQYVADLPEADRTALLAAITGAAPGSKQPVKLAGEAKPVGLIRDVDMGVSVIWPAHAGKQVWMLGQVHGGEVREVRLGKPGDRIAGPEQLAMAYSEAVGAGRHVASKAKPIQTATPPAPAAPTPTPVVMAKPVTPEPAKAPASAPKAEVVKWEF